VRVERQNDGAGGHARGGIMNRSLHEVTSDSCA
jgi:hypothetical protein